MDLALTSDQISLLDAVGKLVSPFRTPPAGAAATILTDAMLDAALRDGGFREVAKFEGMGPLDAALLGEIVHGLPYTVEFIGSALMCAVLERDLSGPLALLEAPGAIPTRFLQAGGVALVLDGADALLLNMTTETVETVETPFAYPLGRLKRDALSRAERITGIGAEVRKWWAVALAVEIGANLKAAVSMTVDYVADRRQFGKPIGSYQGVQHRLAECEVAVHAVQSLARRAAALGDAEAALVALVHAKEACPRVVYDVHQFQGAIGLTYEYPLHFHTYRLRLLAGEGGSLADAASDLAFERWNERQVDWAE